MGEDGRHVQEGEVMQAEERSQFLQVPHTYLVAPLKTLESHGLYQAFGHRLRGGTSYIPSLDRLNTSSDLPKQKKVFRQMPFPLHRLDTLEQ